MKDVAKKENIILMWLYWHFLEMPKNILQAWRNFLLFNLNYFSVPLLFKTFFSPWHGYRWSYGRGFDIGRYAGVFASNLISSILGAILRIFLIVIGLTIEIFIIIAGAVIFLIWLLLPFILIKGLLIVI